MFNFPITFGAKISMIAFSRGSVKFYDVFNIETLSVENIRGGTFRSKNFWKIVGYNQRFGWIQVCIFHE